MSDKIKGSDGIERTLDEWHEFIMDRGVFYSPKNRKNSWTISRRQALTHINYAFNETSLQMDGVGRKQAMESIEMAMERINVFFREVLTVMTY